MKVATSGGVPFGMPAIGVTRHRFAKCITTLGMLMFFLTGIGATEPLSCRILLAAATGSVKASLSPSAAVTSGARWRVDSGAWRTSGSTATGVTAGAHTVYFNTVAGYTSPAAVPIMVLSGKTLTVSGAYVLASGVGSVSVTMEPSPARDEGAQWALDGGAWQSSGVKLSNVKTGSHTISYKPVTGWNTPAAKTITVARNATLATSQVYTITLGNYVAFANNDLGMHCMNQDFSEFMILPPYNTVHAQVIRRGAEPKLMTENVVINYRIPGNTTSVTKTNFWQFAQQLFGVPLAPDVGLTGNRLSGKMVRSSTNEADWVATGIPITQLSDNGTNNPLQLAEFKVYQGATQIARTNSVLPVSWEISCNLCHEQAGASVATNILRAHDRIHRTDLEHQKPVVCGSCHAQAPLGLGGTPGVASLSSAMHTAHAARMAPAQLENSCYACHPGIETQCLRDIHVINGMNCIDCHGDMAAVGNPTRHPWEDEPKCGSCHQRSEYTFEEHGKLYRDSRGHHEVECWVCHGSPHAITPTTTAADNVQALMIQGKVGTINKCSVCHINTPTDKFEHHL